MKKLFTLITCAGLIAFAGCKKEGSYFPQTNDAAGNNSSSTTYSYSKLEVVPDTIHVGDFADIYARATGQNLTYTWGTSHADLFGSGYHIQTGAQPCCVGTNQITCTVSDGTHSETKTVLFTVIF
jgi:hypothetical protein